MRRERRQPTVQRGQSPQPKWWDRARPDEPTTNALPKSGTGVYQTLVGLLDEPKLDPKDPWGTAAPLPPVDLSWMNAPTGAASGGDGGAGDGGAVLAPAPVVFDPESNPEYLRALADIDASEAGAIGDIRVKQEGARRALDDLLADIADRQGKSEVRTKESQEGRGLLRSGATERLLADVAEAAGSERGRGQASTADTISGLERAIAETKIRSQRERGDTRLRFAGLGA